MFGNPLEKVESSYREPLTPSLRQEIRGVHKHFDRTCLLPLLRQFMIEQLCETKWDATSSLKEYLTYMASNVDLDEEEWYTTHFPPTIQLRHTYEFYYHLLEMA